MAYPPNIASQEVIQAEHFNELVRKYRQFWNGPEWNPDGDTPTSSPTFDTSHHTDTERHKGWGQAALVPSEVVSGTIITAENMNNLVAQINAGIFHIEEDPLTLIPKFSAAAIITVPAYTQIMDRLDNIIEARKFELEIINDSLGSVSSVHTNSWSDDLYSEYKATFNNYTEARHYFNSGGQLWLTLESGTQTGGNDPANINWQNMFEKLGEVRIGAIETTASGTGSPSLGGIQGFYSILSTGATVTIFDAAGYHANFPDTGSGPVPGEVYTTSSTVSLYLPSEYSSRRIRVKIRADELGGTFNVYVGVQLIEDVDEIIPIDSTITGTFGYVGVDETPDLAYENINLFTVGSTVYQFEERTPPTTSVNTNWTTNDVAYGIQIDETVYSPSSPPNPEDPDEYTRNP